MLHLDCCPLPSLPSHPPSARLRCSILDIEQSGVPPPPKMDAYLKARVDKMYAQLAVSLGRNAASARCLNPNYPFRSSGAYGVDKV